MVGRYFDRSIPIQCLIAQIYDVVISPIGKGFALDRHIAIRGSIGLHTLAAGELIRRTGRVLVNSQMKTRPRFLLDRHSIQYYLPIAYFYCVAGQADNTLDVIAALTPGRDYDAVPGLRQTAHQQPFQSEERRAGKEW